MNIKNLLKQTDELSELWGYLSIDAEFPTKAVRRWLLDYDEDMVVSAIKVFAKKEERVDDPVKFLAGILRRSKEREMSPEQRDEQISFMRSAIGKVGAAKLHAKELAYLKHEFAEVCQDLPDVAKPLPDFASPLPDVCPPFALSDGVGVGVCHSLCDSDGGSACVRSEPKAAVASLPAVSPSGKRGKQTKTKTKNQKPLEASGVLPNQETTNPKDKPVRHSWKNCPSCDEPMYRDEAHFCKPVEPVCDCGFVEAAEEDHDLTCPVRVKAQAAAAGCGPLGRVPEL